MKLHTYLFKRQLALCSGMVAGALLCGTSAHAGSQSFNFSYSNYVQYQTFTVPAGITSLKVSTMAGGPGGCGGWDVWDDPNGARTSGASGGAAKTYKAVIKVTPGEVIALSQGGVGLDGNTCGGCGGGTGGGSSVSPGGNGGYSGWHGFSGAGGGGGGASAIYKTNGEAFIIAGGGGGGTGATRACPNYNTAGTTGALYAVSGLRTTGSGAGGGGNNFGGSDGSGGGAGGGGYTGGSGSYGQWDVNTALPEYGVGYCSPGGSGGGGASAYNPKLVTSISESGTVRACTPGAAPVMAVTWDELPSITVSKALSGTGRAAATDQFTVQILQDNKVVNNTSNSTTTGSGSVVNPDTGTTGGFGATANTSYTINEVGSNGAVLARYNSNVRCTLNGVAQPAFNLGGSITPTVSDAYICTITNNPKAATLTVRQMVLGPVPVNLLLPYRFDYTGTNGWTSQALINNALNALAAGSTDTLTTVNTATTVSTKLPEPRWFVSVFSCTDTNATISGNPTGVLVTAKTANITIPATYVRPGAALRCTMALGHMTP